MKKSYLIIAVTAALFTACAENDTFKSVAQEPKADQPLAFTAYADKVTRGTNSTALQDFYTVFSVYGWKTVAKTDGSGTENQSVFENVPNEYFIADEGGTTVYKTSGKPGDEWVVPNNIGTGEGKKGYWYYENIRYWDKMATEYQFFAIAPYESTPTYSVNPGDANIAIATSASPYDISTEENLALVADANNNLIPQTSFARFRPHFPT